MASFSESPRFSSRYRKVAQTNNLAKEEQLKWKRQQHEMKLKMDRIERQRKEVRYEDMTGDVSDEDVDNAEEWDKISPEFKNLTTYEKKKLLFKNRRRRRSSSYNSNNDNNNVKSTFNKTSKGITDLKCLDTIADAHDHGVNTLTMIKKYIMASAGNDNSIKIWDVNPVKNSDNKDCILSIDKAHVGKITAICMVGKDDKILASGGKDKTIKLWDITHWFDMRDYAGKTLKGKNILLKNLKGHKRTVTCLIKINDDIIASGSKDCTIKIWDIQEKICLATLGSHTKKVSSLLSIDTSRFVSGGEDKTIHLWNISRLMLQNNDNDSNAAEEEEDIIPYAILKTKTRGEIASLTKLDDNIIALGNANSHSVELWDIDSEYCLGEIEDAHSTNINKILKINKKIFATSAFNEVKFWRIDTTSLIKSYEINANNKSSSVNDIIMPDAITLAYASQNGSIAFWGIGGQLIENKSWKKREQKIKEIPEFSASKSSLKLTQPRILKRRLSQKGIDLLRFGHGNSTDDSDDYDNDSDNSSDDNVVKFSPRQAKLESTYSPRMFGAPQFFRVTTEEERERSDTLSPMSPKKLLLSSPKSTKNKKPTGSRNYYSNQFKTSSRKKK